METLYHPLMVSARRILVLVRRDARPGVILHTQLSAGPGIILIGMQLQFSGSEHIRERRKLPLVRQ